MKKSIFINVIWIGLMLSLLVMSGCVNKDPNKPVEIIDYDDVDVTLIDNWDLWEYQTGNLDAGNQTVEKAIMFSREVEGYPALVEELYANIEKHKITTIDGLINLDSAAEDIESVHMNTCQIWTEDEDENPTYYYDYFYNENSGALWLRSETTADIIWSVDPAIIDTVYVGPDSIAYYVSDEDYTLLYRHNAGPMLILSQPANNSVIPIPGNNDLDDLTPKFKWNNFNNASEYTIQVRLDTLFSEETGFVYNQIVTTNQFTTPSDLDNFAMYYWRVKADNSNWSNIWNFATHQVVILTNPVNRNHEGMKPNFVWLPLQGAAEYTLQVSDNVDFLTPEINITTTNTSYNPTTNLQPNTKYYWRVKGDNSGDNWSDIWYITTDKRISLDPNATPFDDTTEIPIPVAFDWPDLSNTTEYQIEIALDSLFSDVVLNDNTTTSDYIDAGILQTNNEYFWRVNSDVAYDWSDTLSFKTNDVVLLNLPEDGAVDIGVITQFKWEKFNDTGTEYVIQVADENTFANPLVDSHIYYVGSTITCETASRIQENTTDDLIEFIPLLVEDFDPMTVYYWRVQRDFLGWSEIWTFTTLDLAGETVLTEPLDAAEDIEPLAKFKWEAVPGIEFYRMQVSLDPDLADTLWVNKVTTDRTYTLVNNATFNEMLLIGETYYWRARSDRTDWSDIWSFTVRTGIPYDVEAVCLEETPNKVDLLWKCQSGEYTLFWVERSDDNGATWTELGSVADTKREFVDFDLALLTTYVYRARTEYPLGFSDYSDEITITTVDFDTSTIAPATTSVDGGTFSMGSAAGDDDELPLRNITLTHDFEIGTYEISNTEYCKVLNWALGKGKVKGPNGPYGEGFNYAADAFPVGNIFDSDDCCISFSNTAKIYKVEVGMGDYPVIGIKWFGVIGYANWLSMIKGYTPLYSGTFSGSPSVNCDVYSTEGYRLPTEAEWEFAATGGNSTAGYTYSGSNTIDDVAWYIWNAGDALHAVGLKAANELGLKDMSGNAWEWCSDKYGAYDPSTLTDPTGPTGNISNNTTVVVRGGCWEFDAYHLRNANRSFSKANLAYKVNTNIGFRIVKITP
ncbi:MAG: SUMF1/EgtB/PvdO family nonheme iron enzyme [Candidatus Cloacimonadales bacterium]|nr:SUMF1/EgtB/PvdO family nonheme iron enzyme [Candidatus Cloacimonadales bacterium]